VCFLGVVEVVVVLSSVPKLAAFSQVVGGRWVCLRVQESGWWSWVGAGGGFGQVVVICPARPPPCLPPPMVICKLVILRPGAPSYLQLPLTMEDVLPSRPGRQIQSNSSTSW
jgi:hypothetical protein